MTTRTRSTIALWALLGGAIVLATAIWSGRSFLADEELPLCEFSDAVVADAIDRTDLDLTTLTGNEPTTLITELRGETPEDYPTVICEKLFIDAPEPLDRVTNLAIHRYPSAASASSDFPAFYQQSIGYGPELAPGHRYKPEDRRRSAHLAPNSCLTITITWGADNLWEPEQRHAAAIEIVSPLTAAVCPDAST